MAKFECKNCNHFFTKFCDNYNDVEKSKCPECGSHWVELILKKKPKLIFPTLPYTDPHPLPNFGPFPQIKPYEVWCNKPIGIVTLW